MKKLSSTLFKRLGYVFFLLFLGVIISLGTGKQTNYAANIGNATSLQAIHFVSKYDNFEEKLEVREVSDMSEVATYGSDGPVAFIGQMTAYSGYCPGCSGRVACPPAQNVRDGNIFFNDVDYGTVHILAADKNIPCGSIIRITNVTFSSEEILGIVLDRGGAIVGNIVDFLVSNTNDTYSIGRQYNVRYEIIRWGW